MRFAILTMSPAGILAAQTFENNTTKKLTCEQRASNPDRARVCEVREQTMGALPRLDVDATPNGGITIRGWDRKDILVRARVQASARTEAEAETLLGQVNVNTSAGRVRAIGPTNLREAWFDISYEVFVPHQIDLSIETLNGGLTVSDVGGQIRYKTVNGGIAMKRVAGDVKGGTVNGGIDIEVTGDRWHGQGLEATTTNGGVSLSLPAQFSAQLRVNTVHGGVSAGELAAPRATSIDTTLGSGGAVLRLATVNGGVRVKRY
jgi:DUF4097 and DUF4098 domain-containing protein YvlB